MWETDAGVVFLESCETAASTIDFQLTNIFIFPNPVKDKFQLNFLNDEINEIKISNYLGQEIISKKRNNIDVNHLNSGVYFVKVKTTDNKIFSIKMIKE